MITSLRVACMIFLVTLSVACDPPHRMPSPYEQPARMHDALRWANLNLLIDYVLVVRIRPAARQIISLCVKDDPRCYAERVKMEEEQKVSLNGKWFELVNHNVENMQRGTDSCHRGGRIKTRLPRGAARIRHLQHIAQLDPEAQEIRRCKLHRTAVFWLTLLSAGDYMS